MACAVRSQVALFGVSLVMLLLSINGQSIDVSNRTVDLQPLSPDSAVAVPATVIDKVTPAMATVAATGHEEDESKSDESEYEDEEDEQPQHNVDTSTRIPFSSVVTPPMPSVPLQTVFTISGGESDAACIAVKAGIRFSFSYANVSSGKIERGVFDLPARNYTTDGECGPTRQRMSILFSPDRSISPTDAVEAGIAWNLTFVFVRNKTDIYADQLSLRYVITPGKLPFPWSVDARLSALLKQPGMFRTPSEEHSFICMSDAGYGNFVIVTDSSNGDRGESASLVLPAVEPATELAGGMTSSSTNQSVHLDLVELYNLQLQAFLKPPPKGPEGSQTPVTFSSQVIQCSGDFISIKVPVIVGIILLVFVVSVVVVYMARRLMHGKSVDEKKKSVDYRPVH